MTNFQSKKIAILLPSLSGGGVASSILRIAEMFILDGYQVDLLITKPRRKPMVSIPDGMNLIHLKSTFKLFSRLTAIRFDLFHPGRWFIPLITPFRIDRNLTSLKHLIQYLNQKNPSVLLTAPTYTNIIALIANKIAQSSTKVVISEHAILTQEIINKSNKSHWKYLPNIIAKTYPSADNIIAVSEGVKRDLALNSGIPEHDIKTIYNPVITKQFNNYLDAPVEHIWFKDPNTPVILGVGRLLPEKDWPTLLKAFTQVRKYSSAKLVIFGEGSQRKYLEQLTIDMNIREHIDLPGFTDNPYAYMAKADVFALSSKYEGLGNVIIEALACGCPVVSTDCPSGPAEILVNGEYGRLVPVGDYQTMALAILKTLEEQPESEKLQYRAWHFSVEKAYRKYRRIMLGAKSDG